MEGHAGRTEIPDIALEAALVGRTAELESLAAFLAAPWPRLVLLERRRRRR